MESIFKGLRPAAVALIASPIYSMAKNAKVNRKNVIIPIIAAILVAFVDLSPIYIILIAAVGGIVYYSRKGRKA